MVVQRSAPLAWSQAPGTKSGKPCSSMYEIARERSQTTTSLSASVRTSRTASSPASTDPDAPARARRSRQSRAVATSTSAPELVVPRDVLRARQQRAEARLERSASCFGEIAGFAGPTDRTASLMPPPLVAVSPAQSVRQRVEPLRHRRMGVLEVVDDARRVEVGDVRLDEVGERRLERAEVARDTSSANVSARYS